MVNNVSELERDIQVIPPVSDQADASENVRLSNKKSLAAFFLITRLCISVSLFLLSALLPVSEQAGLCILICAFLIAGLDTIIKAVTGIISLDIYNESFITAVACAAALTLGYTYECAALLLLSKISDIPPLHTHALYRKSISRLLKPPPEITHVIRDSQLMAIPTRKVVPGSLVTLEPNKAVCFDGAIVSGETSMDTSALTGRPQPVKLSPGNQVLSGFYNISNPVTVRTTASYSCSASSKIVEHAEKSGRADSDFTISNSTRFLKAYIPAAIGAAVAAILLQFLIYTGSIGEWLGRSLLLLALSCPCALMLSIPLTLKMTSAGSLKKGILFKDITSVAALSKTKIFIFDKTGTLTTGKYKVVSAEPESISDRMLIMMAAHALAFSSYPNASAVIEAFDGEVDHSLISGFRNYNGTGITIMVKGLEISCGSAVFMERLGIQTGDDSEDESVIHVAAAGKYAGRILLSDTVKADAPRAVYQLQKLGAKRIIMLAEEKPYSARKLSSALGINEFRSECQPEDKLDFLETVMRDKRKNELAAFIGNGICSSPALILSDVGICLGTSATDGAAASSDVHIIGDSPVIASEAAAACITAGKIIRMNTALSISLKIVAAVLCLTGRIPLWGGILMEAAAAAVTVINATRAGKNKLPAEQAV